MGGEAVVLRPDLPAGTLHVQEATGARVHATLTVRPGEPEVPCDLPEGNFRSEPSGTPGETRLMAHAGNGEPLDVAGALGYLARLAADHDAVLETVVLREGVANERLDTLLFELSGIFGGGTEDDKPEPTGIPSEGSNSRRYLVHVGTAGFG